MSKSQEERIAGLEKIVEKQGLENEKLWETVQRLVHRCDQLRGAVPHVQFRDW